MVLFPIKVPEQKDFPESNRDGVLMATVLERRGPNEVLSVTSNPPTICGCALDDLLQD
jgi:hypothetical protein